MDSSIIGPTTVHCTGSAASLGVRRRLAGARGVDRPAIARHERAEEGRRQAAALELEHADAGGEVAGDVAHARELARREVLSGRVAVAGLEPPRLLADAEAGPDAAALHAPRLAHRVRQPAGQRGRLEVHVAGHPAAAEEHELLDHVAHDLDGDPADRDAGGRLGGVDRPRQHDRRRARVAEEGDVGRVLGAASDAGGEPEGGEAAGQRREDAGVVDDQGPHAELEEAGNLGEEERALGRAGDRVEGDLELGPVTGGQPRGGGELLAVQLAARPAPAPALEPDVDRVGARLQRGREGVEAAGRREERAHRATQGTL